MANVGGDYAAADLAPEMRISSSRTIEAAATEALRRRILTGDLRPGTPLLQAELALQLGTSITPIRAALTQLAGEGLVRAEPHHTMFVAEPTPAALKEVYEMRLLLEPSSVARAAKLISARDLDRAERLLQQMESADDMGEWSSLNRDFHALLVSASGSVRLTRVMLDLLGLSALQIRRVLPRHVSGRRESADLEHRDILAAMRAGDPRAAHRLVLLHLRSSDAATRTARSKAESPKARPAVVSEPSNHER
ncbi:MAG TPA: GntR family transcriptional regulator [Candidatus Dormibacteraeota bacterium]